MSLTAVEPDRELVDGLSLDAAWERAKDLEKEVTRLRAMLKATNDEYRSLGDRYGKLVNGIWLVIGQHPGTGEVLTGLMALLDK